MSAIITAVALSAVGTGISAWSAVDAGKAAQGLGNYNAATGQQAADYNADLGITTADANASRILAAADFNATVDAQNAHTARRDSLADAGNVRFNNRRVMASQRAKMAAGGVVGDAGSPLMVQTAQAGLLEMRAMEAELSGQRRATQFEQAGATELWQAGEQAKVTRWQAGEEAKMTRWAGGRQAALDVMQGASAKRAGYLNATASLVDSVSSIVKYAAGGA